MKKLLKKYKNTSLMMGVLAIAVVSGVCGGAIVQSINKNSCATAYRKFGYWGYHLGIYKRYPSFQRSY